MTETNAESGTERSAVTEPNSDSGEKRRAGGQQVGQLPHFALRSAGVRPPIKPGLMGTGTNLGQGGGMSTSTQSSENSPERGSERGADRAFMDRFAERTIPSAAYAPARRTTEIPSPASVKAAEAESEGKRLTIGRQVRVSGEIAGCAHLTVEGNVDAKVSEARSINVTASGTMKGSAEIDSAVIAGTFDGTLVVNGHLDILATGRVSGTISYRALTIATGGKISGTITEISG